MLKVLVATLVIGLLALFPVVVLAVRSYLRPLQVTEHQPERAEASR